MKKVKIIKIKPMPIVWVNEKHDTDNDGVPNYFDCNPWNPNQQGWLHDKLKKRKQIPEEATKETIDAEYEVKKPKGYLYGRYAGKKIYDTKGGYTQKARWHKIEKPEDLDKRYRSGLQPERVVASTDPDLLRKLKRAELREHMKARKEQVQDYIDERSPQWKKNVMSGLGLKTKEEKEVLQKLKQYQKIIAMERKMGASPIITHQSSELFSLIKTPSKRDKQLFVDQHGRYVNEKGEPLFMDREGRVVDEEGNIYDM